MLSVQRSIFVLILFLAAAAPAWAQLTLDQKVHDFQNLASLFAKHYAPLEWKKRLLGVDALQITPWLARIRRSQDDLDFLEICAEYAASLNDAHASFFNGSSFAADSGLFVDIYDGKVLIEAINRLLLPARQFPFEVGDELVAVDGKPVDQFIREYSRVMKVGHEQATRRLAADLIVFRPQLTIPRAHEIPEASDFDIRRRDGTMETHKITWDKFGYPLERLGPVPSPNPFKVHSPRMRDESEGYLKPLMEMQNWSVRRRAPGFQRHREAAAGEGFVLGWGRRAPPFAPPPNLVQRLGRFPSEFHFSGTYTAGGKRLGYLRIPSFAPPNATIAVREMLTEILFFQANTDGLVVDIMRNDGGGCYLLTAASLLMKERFHVPGQQVRPSLSTINSFQQSVEVAREVRAAPWVITLLENYLSQLVTAYKENRGTTGPLPLCSLSFEEEPARDFNGGLISYTKPMILLIDEFSSSAAEIFAAVIQDNRRGLLVGSRTMGAGGTTSLSGFDAGVYSETGVSMTFSLLTRRDPVSVPGFPDAPFIENIGVHPDVPLEFMTEENLRNRGLTFVQDFTGVLVDWILRQE